MLDSEGRAVGLGETDSRILLEDVSLSCWYCPELEGVLAVGRLAELAFFAYLDEEAMLACRASGGYSRETKPLLISASSSCLLLTFMFSTLFHSTTHELQCCRKRTVWTAFRMWSRLTGRRTFLVGHGLLDGLRHAASVRDDYCA